jgi:hypothetical protein
MKLDGIECPYCFKQMGFTMINPIDAKCFAHGNWSVSLSIENVNCNEITEIQLTRFIDHFVDYLLLFPTKDKTSENPWLYFSQQHLSINIGYDWLFFSLKEIEIKVEKLKLLL